MHMKRHFHLNLSVKKLFNADALYCPCNGSLEVYNSYKEGNSLLVFVLIVDYIKSGKYGR
jgi:hypothetical protein